MVSIIRFDNSCKIVDEDDLELYKALDNELSFQIKGAEFSAAYQGYINESGEFVTWDGKRHLLNSNGRFPVGLLPRVQEFFFRRGIYVPVIDQRTSRSPLLDLDISSNLQKLGKIPRPYQIMAAETAVNTDRGIIRMATGSGKCQCKNSLILTDQGLLTYEELLGDVKIDNQEALPKDVIVSTTEKFGNVEKTSMIYHDGYGPSKRIVTSYGFENTMTPEHKIQVMSDSGSIEWKRCEDLKENDYILISFGNQMFGNQDMDLDEAYWYGLLFGDGSLTRHDSIRLTNMDDHIIEFSKLYIESLGYKYKEYTKSKARDIVVNSKKYRDYLYNIGFGYERSITKTIPKIIRSLKKEPLAMFIRGLYETDGWVDYKKSKQAICIGLSNKKAIDQLHLLLLNFGIISSRRVKKTTNEDSHILTIYRSSIPAFVENIGFDPSGVKFKKLQDAMTHISIQNDNNFIPNQSIRLKEVLCGIDKSKLKNAPVKWNTIRSWIGESSWRNPTRDNLTKLLNWCICNNSNSEAAQSLLTDISGVFFDKIVSIQDTESDNYDFVVPKTHSFVSQGFVNHNTMVSALITSKVGKRALILVIGKDLLYQTNNFFTKVFGQEIGIIGDGKCEIRDINVATIWSVGKALGIKNITIDDDNDSEKSIDSSKFKNIKQMLLDSSIVILDECQISSCDTVQAISRNIKGEYVYGMSASPWRDDGADMLIEAFLGRKIVDISARTLINQGYLVEPNIRFLAPKPYKFKSGQYQSIYSKYVVENEQRNGMVIKGAQKLVEQGFVPLVLFHTIKHGDILFKELKKNIPTALLSGKDNSNVRERIKTELEDGKLKCLVASKIFDIGIDLPILSGLVTAGAGKSSVRALQRIGRVIRPYPGKKVSAVLDFSDQAPYLADHADIRRQIYESEFNVQWPQEKSNKDS